jgi:hypothetical protein
LLLYLLALLNAIITMTCVSRARSCIKLQELMQLDTCRAIKGKRRNREYSIRIFPNYIPVPS